MVTLSICSNLVCLQVCILVSAPKNSSFQSHPRPTYYQRKQHSKSWKLEINFSQGSAAALCRWGGQISNFVLHIIFVYSMPNIVEMYVCVCVCVCGQQVDWMTCWHLLHSVTSHWKTTQSSMFQSSLYQVSQSVGISTLSDCISVSDVNNNNNENCC